MVVPRGKNLGDGGGPAVGGQLAKRSSLFNLVQAYCFVFKRKDEVSEGALVCMGMRRASRQRSLNLVC